MFTQHRTVAVYMAPVSAITMSVQTSSTSLGLVMATVEDHSLATSLGRGSWSV